MEGVGNHGPPVDVPAIDGAATVAEAAFEAGVTRQTVHGWIRRGHLAAEPDAQGAIRVRRDELRRFVGLRRAAKAANVRLGTVRHWADGTDGT